MESERGINEVDDSIFMNSIFIKNVGFVEKLAKIIAAKLPNDSPLRASCCIFRVPDKIRRKKEQAYQPDIVSIGPFHISRRGEQFQFMENVKRWYLQCLLQRENITLANLIKGVEDLDKYARDCYAEPLDHLKKEDFVEMMVLDGCFLIELFRKVSSGHQRDDDPFFNLSRMWDYLYHDLILLENQLPWFVLKELYNLTAVNNTTGEGNASSLTGLVLNFFRQSDADIRLLKPSVNLPPKMEILHILDLIRSVIVFPYALGSQQKEEDEDPQQSKEIELSQRIPNLTTLSKVGVKLKSSKPQECIMNITFENGVFTIPPLAIGERTGPLFRNLIAFEQCHHSCPHMVTSYAVLMDNLIKSSNDIDLLCEKGILANWLSTEDAAKFFKELTNDTTAIGFCYEGLWYAVNQYYYTDWNKWMQMLRREHFGLALAATIFSLVSGFILLVLTMLQTVYTVHQYYRPPK